MKIAKQIAYNHKEYSFLSDDTRCVLSEPNVLFVRTKQNARFADEIATKGLDILDAGDLKHHFSLTPKIIGITGTNGKTTTAAIIYSILLDMGHSCALLGTRGFFANDKPIKPKGLTTPGVLELYKDIETAALLGCEYFVMEVSSHAIEQERIAGLSFCAKILTNITSDHLDYHKSLEEYIRVKNSFFDDETLKIINRDEPKALFNPKNARGYAISSKTHLSVNAYSLTQGISAHLNWKENASLSTKQNGQKTPQTTIEETLIDSPLYGLHNLYNILAALACIKCLTQASLQDIAKHLENFAGVSGRMEVISQTPLIIVDFAHTHDGMKQIFESFKSKKISVVFGAGGDRDKSKRPKMGECATNYAQKITITSDNPRTEDPNAIINDILAGIPQSYLKDFPQNHSHRLTIEPDRKKAIKQAVKEQMPDEVLLILGKGDETCQIIAGESHHFDDREIVREALAELGRI
ncbi:UDP-N-acetylmuramoyl-L-alanyl-D-glutamate--2,6-diaminopimelate ligase [Helicobacter sp. 11S02596-1]|uniref:UDP-N-acetylmuramoyl-L-alanyl-D-glutamate--2, 6-diaminopimelate ligase n=1 Tax=Helicobacter sp. 11S02596-1 TaxID=1476194 RepID=UPI000BA5B169|nr:UDP-N-acetylmuramoyl-L-alanyl-D-glutamate--2,6-diaminopimelate ligase [Helicobacter sp. 11S02596-1]PAF45106.1 UDP-N-acetylmuramoyl-L-alanyl-D-glutamate--2,6-diaminopimelate ligase [Helicobacter sp. 11S02596-1]